MTDANNMRRYLKLFEAAAPDYVGPKASDTVTYAAEQTKGKVSKITATLKSYDSARYTKLGRNLLRIETLTEEIKVLQAETKAEARELVADLFHAEDAACTRVVDTVGFMFHMTKDPVASGSVSYSKVLDELQAHLTPELLNVLETLKAKHTSAPVQRAASLKATDKAPKTEESIVEGIGDKLAGFFKKVYQEIKGWGASYDSKLDMLKREVGISEGLAEGWAEERQAFYAEIAKSMGQTLDYGLIDAIEAAAITQDEWMQNPLNCKQRIRGAQEEMYNSDLGEERVDELSRDTKAAYLDKAEPSQQELFQKGGRGNQKAHTKSWKRFDWMQKAKADLEEDEIDYDQLKQQLEKDHELRKKYDGYYQSPKGGGYIQGWDHENEGNVIILVDTGTGVRSKNDDSKATHSVPLKSLTQYRNGKYTPVDESNEGQTALKVKDLVKINSPRSSAHGEYGHIDAIEDAPEDQGGNHYKVVLLGTGYWAMYDEHELEPATQKDAYNAYRQR